jgi:hypothetical protein
MLEREPSPLTNMLVWLFAYKPQQATVWALLCTCPINLSCSMILTGLVPNRQRSRGRIYILSSYQF